MTLAGTIREGSFIDRLEVSQKLPSLPGIVMQLIEACNREDIPVKEMAGIIEKDPGLTVKVLKMVNSAYLRLSQRVDTIETAIVLLGIEAIKNIAICTGVRQVFGKIRGNDLFDLKAFWRHSLLCAVVARLLARETRYRAPDEAFLCGLLHDLGRLVLWSAFQSEYSAVLARSEGDPDRLLAEEARLVGSHAEVGAWLLRQWNLHPLMADAVLYHHEPPSRIREAFPLVKIVYVADRLSLEIPGAMESVIPEAERLLDLSRSDIDSVVSRSAEEVEEVARSLDIEIASSKEKGEAVSRPEQGSEASLLREVETVSLLYGTARSLVEAENEEALVRSILQGLQAVVGVQTAWLLVCDEDSGGLSVRFPEAFPDPAFSDLVIPWEKGGNLPAESLRQGVLLDSFSYAKEGKLSILDEQLVRMMESEGILCVPLLARKRPVGVIAIGLGEGECARLTKAPKLLEMFSRQAALALYAHRVKLEEARRIQEERLSAAAEVARNVVHEINNPLGIIKNYLKILSMKLPDEDAVQEDIQLINEEINRVARILRQLSNFSGSPETGIEPVDVNALFSQLAGLTQRSLSDKAEIRFHLDLDPVLPRLLTSKDSLKQIFINLVRNSVEAMGGRGSITIRTRLLPSAGEEKGVAADRRVEIVFRDDGPGIPKELVSSVFEPFVSTKGAGHRGVGLSIVYNLVRELGGTIQCESGEGRGTSFRIVVPVRKPQP